MSGYLPQDMYLEIAEFLFGDKVFIKRKNAANRIARWWKKQDKLEDLDDIYNKNEMIRYLMFKTDDSIIFSYPEFAKNKLALYSFDVIEPIQENTKKSHVRNWMLTKLNAQHIQIVGI